MKKTLIISLFVFFLISSNVKGAISGVSLVDDTVFDNKGKMWIIDWGYQYSDYIKATLNPSDFKEKTGYESYESFTLSMTSGDEYATYRLNHFAPIWKIEVISSPWSLSWSQSDIEDWVIRNCWDADGNGYAGWVGKTNAFGWIQQIFCVKQSEYIGDVYRIGTPKSIFSVNWKFQASGKEPKTITISNDNNVKPGLTTSLDNVIKIRWKGSFSTGQIPPVATLMYASKGAYGGWALIDQDTYDSYRDSLTGDLTDKIKDYIYGRISKESIENPVNTLASNVIYKWTSNSEFPSNKITFGATYFNLDLEERVFIPSFQVLVDGDYYVKVIIPYGEPKIVSVNLPTLTEDYDATASVVVKNVGNDVGDFEVWMRCEPVGKMSYSPRQVLRGVKPGTTQTATFTISIGDIDQTGKYTCDVCAKDTISQKIDCFTKSAQYNPRITCKLGQQTRKFINGVWCVLECNGVDFELKMCCEPGEELKLNTLTGEYECYKPVQCTTDADCPAGYQCINNLCYKPECVTDEDCGAGEICRDGKCIKANCETIRDADLRKCGWNPICIMGAWFSYFACVFVTSLMSLFMIVGAIVVVLIIIFIAFKLILKR